MSKTLRTLLSGTGVAFILAVGALVVSAACGASPSEPSEPAKPLCQVNNTATVTFENRSANNSTYAVVWDGSTWTTLAPSVKSAEFTVAAGIQHTLTFKIANSSNNACTTSTPTLAQCSSNNYWCTY